MKQDLKRLLFATYSLFMVVLGLCTVVVFAIPEQLPGREAMLDAAAMIIVTILFFDLFFELGQQGIAELRKTLKEQRDHARARGTVEKSSR